VSYLLDTNVVAELTRRRPDRGVLRWFETTPEESLHVSVLSLGELRAGVEGQRDAARREKVRVFLERDLPKRFEDRLLPISAGVADRWGRLLAAMERTVPAIDSLLAATALFHGLRIVTRNVRDFRFPGLDVVNPWEIG
jgi:hypothetical protein